MKISTASRQILQRFGLEYFNKYYGVYRAIVADNNDPDKLGRLKLKIPQIYGDQEHDYWAWCKGMFAGKNIGFLAFLDVTVYFAFFCISQVVLYPLLSIV